jgi:hypothetical protein
LSLIGKNVPVDLSGKIIAVLREQSSNFIQTQLLLTGSGGTFYALLSSTSENSCKTISELACAYKNIPLLHNKARGFPFPALRQTAYGSKNNE